MTVTWVFFFKQKTAYEMRMSDWSSDVCASDLLLVRRRRAGTFVAEAKHLNSSIWHFRFRAPQGDQLLPWLARVTAVETIEGDGPWSDFLGLMPDYIRIRRVVNIADKFNVHAEMYLEGPRFRPLLDIPVDVLSSKNLRVFIHERFNAPTFRAVHRVTTTDISAEIADR